MKADKDPLAELRELSSKDLKQRLLDALGLTVEGLREAANCFMILEDRDDFDVKDIPRHWRDWLREIARERMLPEVVVTFARNQRLVSRIGQLEPKDQRRLAALERVPVVVGTDDPKRPFTTAMKTPLEMAPEQISQVFGRKELRTEAQQIARLQARRDEERKPAPKEIGGFPLVPEVGLYVEGKPVTWEVMVAALKWRERPGRKAA